MEQNHPSHQSHGKSEGNPHYKHLLIMSILSFIAMYYLMYAMVDGFNNVINNINQVYMAGLMTAPMILIEIFVMRGMYTDRRKNTMAVAIGVVLLLACYFGIRTQAGVGDKQFLKSMIPHHAAAILMVQETTLHDEELKKLAGEIISAQQKEIDFMKAKLKDLDQSK